MIGNQLWVPQYNGNCQIFYYCGGQVQTWHKPPGTSYVSMLAIGGGGAGGAGFLGGAGTRGGGGGGGSGAISKLVVAAYIIPDVLYISVGAGGIASNGVSTLIGIDSTFSGAVMDLFLDANPGSVGTNGGSGGTAAGGLAATINTIADCRLSHLGTFFSVAGDAGANAGTAGNNNGAGRTAYTTHILTGGGGGASTNTTNQTGGAITGAGIIPTIAGGAGATRGNDGIYFNKPFAATGGSGGGSSSGGAAGAGGIGAFGCGGGGGGAGVSGGAGGNGGNGIVFIWSY